MQYIGTAEEEAGLLIGSHVHDSSPTVMTDEIIENGFFVSRGRPNEGMRLVYIPRDQGDLEFFENSHLINLKSLTFVNVGNWNNPTNEYAIEDPTDTTTTSEHVAEGNLAKYCVKDVFGLGTKKIQGTQPYQLVISWTGMKPS